jgi:hypothetical protein
VVIRNNLPITIESDREIRRFLDNLESDYSVNYIAERFNIGFGGGHNKTLRERNPDILVAINNDINFNDGSWLLQGIISFDDPRVAIVGPEDAPRSVDIFNAAGKYDNDNLPEVYAEGSVLFVRGEFARKYGLFDESYQYAYFEDVDLSLRAKQAGYLVRYIDISHNHQRSSSSNRLPKLTIQSLYEHNKASFFRKWSKAIRTQHITSRIHFDLVSDGIGDVVAATPHVFSYIDKYSAETGEFHITIKQSNLAFIFNWIPNVRVFLSTDENEALVEYDAVFSLRGLPYNLPFSLKVILDSYIHEYAYKSELLNRFIDSIKEPNVSHTPLDLDYFVLHAERSREGWHGRFFPARNIIEKIPRLKKHEAIVIVGLDPEEEIPSDVAPRIIDLRGKLTMEELFCIVKRSLGVICVDSLVLHIAQLFNKPAFSFFGSTLPETRLYKNEISVGWTNPKLDCIGCYHNHIKPAYNFCMRGDERCLNISDDEALIAKLASFINCARKRDLVINHDRHIESYQSQIIKLLAFNPLYRSIIFSTRENNTNLSDMLNNIMDLAQQGMEIGHGAKYRNLKLQVSDMKLEQTRLRRLNIDLADRVLSDDNREELISAKVLRSPIDIVTDDSDSPTERGVSSSLRAEKIQLFDLKDEDFYLRKFRVNNIIELFAFDREEFVSAVYINVLGRLPDKHGMMYYLGRLAMGYSKSSIIVQIAASSEAKGREIPKGIEKLVHKERGLYNFLRSLLPGQRS